MPEYLPFVIFGIVFVGIIVVVIVKTRAGSKARVQRFMGMGFTPVEDDAALVEKITRLENNAGYRYSVKDPMRAEIKGGEIYFYEKSRRRSDDLYVAEEFLFPLTRSSGQGLMLFLKPTNIPSGTATKLIGAVATGAWDAQPDDLRKLEIPMDLRDSNLIGAMGPAGASLDDLIDRQTLGTLMQVGDLNGFLVLCRDSLCSISSPVPRMPLDVERVWSFLQSLV